MSALRSRCLAPALFVLLAAIAPAQKPAAPPDAKSRVDAVFARFHRAGSPGCAVGVSIEDAPVLAAAYGMADLEHDVPLTPESIFEPGSITKQFTAAAVLLLAREGKLSLDDPVRKYIPELPDYGAPLTIRHLLNHTSGLRDWGNLASIGGWPRTTRVHTHAHVLEILSRQRALNYPPGADYSYTNSGYNLSAMLVERVAGKSLPEFSREAIFKPLGMNSTQWRDDFRRIVPGRAIAYTSTAGTFRQDMPFENVFGNGGLLTTVGDLLRWNRNFTRKTVGGPEFVAAQLQRGRLNDGRQIAYAAGLMILHWKGLPEVSHAGSTAGYSAWLGRYPEQALSVAVLCNVTTNATQFGHQVADIYLGGAIPPRAAEPAVTVDPASLASKAGLYRSLRDNQPLNVELRDGKLQVERRGALKPFSDSSFAMGDDGSRAEFEAGPGGALRLRLVTEVDAGNVFEKVERANPSRAELEALAGEYRSDEADVTFTVRVEQDRLVIRRPPDNVIALTPTFRDAFNGSVGSVRFLRDAARRVNGLSVGDSRVWDLRFRRLGAARER